MISEIKPFSGNFNELYGRDFLQRQDEKTERSKIYLKFLKRRLWKKYKQKNSLRLFENGITQYEEFCGHNANLYGARLDPKNKKRPPRLFTQHNSTSTSKSYDLWAHLVTGFQTGENSSTVTKRFVTSTRQPCIKNNKGAFIQTQSRTRLCPGVSSSTTFNINAKFLTIDLRAENKPLFSCKTTLTPKEHQ